jgi:methylmalonyl-CoA mutase
MGKDSHDHETKLLFTLFAENGFDVDISPPHQTPRQAARMAIENDAHIICFLSTENNYKNQVTDLSDVLKTEHAESIRIVIGGAIPHSDYDLLYSVGVSLILNSAPIDTVSINRLLDLFER